MSLAATLPLLALLRLSAAGTSLITPGVFSWQLQSVHYRINSGKRNILFIVTSDKARLSKTLSKSEWRAQPGDRLSAISSLNYRCTPYGTRASASKSSLLPPLTAQLVMLQRVFFFS